MWQSIRLRSIFAAAGHGCRLRSSGSLLIAGLGVLLFLLATGGRAEARALCLAPQPQPATPDSEEVASGSPEMMRHRTFMPIVLMPHLGCEPIEGQVYHAVEVDGPHPDPPAEENADLNLGLRGYEPTDAYLGLVDYNGDVDLLAPQLDGLFADGRPPQFAAAFRVYDWNWDCNCRGELLDDYDVTLALLAAAPGETIHVPDSGYGIGDGYEVLVLYAGESRITLKYTREDNVIQGYTLQLEGVCVEPTLLAMYRRWDAAGREWLPALESGQPFARALGVGAALAIRDCGTFMDPRSRKDWWYEHIEAK